MSLHKELAFEDEICAHLAAHGWLCAPKDNASYDRARALFPADLLAWVQETQPDAWSTLVKNHGPHAADTVASRLRQQLDQRGTLDVLRHGIELLGLKKALQLAQFKPALALNPEVLARYAANRLRVVRQVRYSIHHENSLDLVLFLNGVPVATAELKSDFTQRVGDAVDQYRLDRDPRPKGKSPEPLLGFPGGALVHFAVSHAEVQTTTALAGPDTTFLPFNQGNGDGAGNPPNPDGHRTAYLWTEVWQRDSWLEVLGRYVVGRRNAKGQIERVVFPRYHQLDVTRKLEAAVRRDGVGKRYLVQHSAGSGKTNSIAWTAHFLSELHRDDHQKVFDTVLVVSDRNVIDRQLQEALFDFQRVSGVVEKITDVEGSKSGKLAAALSGDKKIVVCTIQTFPFALEAVRSLAATQGKRFAVLADEAHSSQSGEAAAKLKATLGAGEADEGEVTVDDVLTSEMAARAQAAGITFVAFTATPKAKTLELFGTLPDPTRGPAPDNLPAPFHVYSMRQAIEEGFILDVLQNYTSWSVAFRLAHAGAEVDETEVERSAALKRLMGWVKLHPYNIAKKVEVVIEHFRGTVAPLLDGRAKAMVVVGSRLEAVRWKLAIEKYVAGKGYAIGTLVAFSGEVFDDAPVGEAEGEVTLSVAADVRPPSYDGLRYTEASHAMNPTLRGRDLREAFAGDEFQILLVANKFQTGFDQPLLCGMYVDRRLAGIQAVQTLSRLNRAHPGKDTTYVVDFVNEPEEILAAFKLYHSTAELAGTTDPNLVFDLRAKLDAAGHYDDAEVERVVRVLLDPRARQSELVAALEPVVDRLLRRYATARAGLSAAKARGDDRAAKEFHETVEALLQFKRDLGAYVRLYTFLSQIFDYGNTALEKRALFYKRLLPLLDFEREREGIDLSKVRLTHHTLRSHGKRDLPLTEGDQPLLAPMTASGSGAVQEREKARLAEIIEKLNEVFQGALTDQDKLAYIFDVVGGKVLESETLAVQAANNTEEQFATSPDLDREIESAILDAQEAHDAMSSQALSSPQVRRAIKSLLLSHGHLWASLRARSTARP